MFAAIADGAADLVLAPVENSLAGSVYRCYDLLLESKLQHHRRSGSADRSQLDWAARRHAGAGPLRAIAPRGPGTMHPLLRSSIPRSRAWPPKTPAAACAKWCAAAIPSAPPSPAAAPPRSTAARSCSRISKIIAGTSHAFSCFRITRPRPPGPTRSLWLSFCCISPAPYIQALEPIARQNINLVKIESRPIVGHPFEYCFYLDVMASPEAPGTQAALRELREQTSEVRILGCYVAATGLLACSAAFERGMAFGHVLRTFVACHLPFALYSAPRIILRPPHAGSCAIENRCRGKINRPPNSMTPAYLQCIEERCQRRYPLDNKEHQCSACGGLLDVRYDFPRHRSEFDAPDCGSSAR